MADPISESVSISGNTVVAGDPDATVGGNTYQGAVYVFTEPTSGWGDMTQTAKLTASDGAAGDGWLVGFDQRRHNRGRSPDATVGGNTCQGAVYVFTEPASGWENMTQTAKLTASDGAAGDGFGWPVSISGNTLVVGPPDATVGGNTRQGAAYVFTEPVSGWVDMTQTAELTASDGTAHDGFAAVSISGNTVVFGVEMVTGSVVYVFTEPASGWTNMTQTAELMTSGNFQNTRTGISISGDMVVVGNPSATLGGNDAEGAAYVFTTPSPPTLTVTPAYWTSAGLTLTLGSDGNLHVYTTGTTTDAVTPVAPASVSNIEITSPTSTTANLTIDSTNGDPIPAGGLDYSGAGGLIITGSGTVTLSGANSYTGRTTISAGTLLVNAASVLPNGTSLTSARAGPSSLIRRPPAHPASRVQRLPRRLQQRWFRRAGFHPTASQQTIRANSSFSRRQSPRPRPPSRRARETKALTVCATPKGRDLVFRRSGLVGAGRKQFGQFGPAA